jgi:hypothetical protein
MHKCYPMTIELPVKHELYERITIQWITSRTLRKCHYEQPFLPY